LRFLPSFDELGNELEFMVPGADPKNMQSALSDAFYQAEMTTLYRRGESKHFISTLAPTDKKGNAIPACYKTVAGMVIGRFNYNVMVAKQMMLKGYSSNIPQEWIAKYDAKLTNEQRPTIVTMAQAVASVIDGAAMRSPTGAATYVPGIFIFQKTALDSLFMLMSSRRDMSKPISQANLNPNSDLFSCANGHIAQYTMQLKKGDNGKERPVYGLVSSESAPLDPNLVKQWVQPWSQLITEPVIEDQIALLVDWLGADVVDFGLTNSPFEEYLPVNVRGKSEGLECTRLKWDEVKAMPQNPNRVVAAPKPVAAPVSSPAPVPMAVQMPTPPPAQGPAPARPARQIHFKEEDDLAVEGTPAPARPARQIHFPEADEVPMGTTSAPATAETATPPGANDFAANLMKSMASLRK
jgi:hypothetical protein